MHGNGSAYQPATYTDLSALSYCTNLETLQISGQSKLETLPLAGLTKLKKLYIFDNPKIQNITGISSCTDLDLLSIYSCAALNSLAGFEVLPNLTYLNVYNTAISNLGFMQNKTKLKFQYQYNADGTVVKDKYGNNVVLWETLNLKGNNISNLTPLLNIITEGKQLEFHKLNISNNPIEGNIVANNIDVLKKLHTAGITDITITGTSFTPNEVQELISVYGSGHVTN